VFVHCELNTKQYNKHSHDRIRENINRRNKQSKEKSYEFVGDGVIDDRNGQQHSRLHDEPSLVAHVEFEAHPQSHDVDGH
jgi:hypothetical protein